MANTKKEKLTIGLMRSPDRQFDKKFHIEIEDENFTRLFDLVVSPENMALALAGYAYVECEVEEL